MAGLLNRKAQIALKIESVEGTEEVLAAADAAMLVYDPTYTPDIAKFVRNPARSKLTPLGSVSGQRSAAISWRTELKGSGALTATSYPSWDSALRACGFTRNAVSGASVSTIVGTFVPGETITGGTSGATARVVSEWSGAAGEIRFVPTSGATVFVASDGLVGSVSGATCHISGLTADEKGFEYRPTSANVPSATVGLYMDGLKHPIRGARGTVAIEATIGEPAFLNFTFSGVYSAVTAAALLSGISYEDVTPKAFLCVELNISGFTPVFASCTLDIANSVEGRSDANDCSGFKSFIIPERAPTGSLDPEMELPSTHDFYALLLANTTKRLHYKLDDPDATPAAGEIISVSAPKFEYNAVGKGDRAGVQIAEVEINLVAADVSGGDDELVIAML